LSKESNLYKRINSIPKRIKKWRNLHKKDVYISIGENCLSDNILSRNKLKSFSSPFASGRSNIEYILSFENERYNDFLNPDYLHYEFDDSNKKVVRNKKFVAIKNRYNDSCMKGLELTHHDIIADVDARKKLQRRVNRILGLKRKNIIMLYHQRICEETNLDLLIRQLHELSQIYELRKNKVSIYLFYQVIVSNYIHQDVLKSSRMGMLRYSSFIRLKNGLEIIKMCFGLDVTMIYLKR